MRKLFMSGLLGAVLVAGVGCEEKLPEEGELPSIGDGTDGGGAGPSGIAIDAASAKFQFTTVNIGAARAATNLNNTSVPAKGSPTIDMSTAITGFTVPATPTKVDIGNGTLQGIMLESTPARPSLVATTRTHSVLVTEDASTCTSSLSLTCVPNNSNPKLLDISALVSSALTASTTSIPLTVNGTSLSAPVARYDLTEVGPYDPYIPHLSYNYASVAETADYAFLYEPYVSAGSTYGRIYRVKKSDNSLAVLYQPSNRNIHYLTAFNNAIYMNVRTTATTGGQFIKYDPTTNTFSNLSGTGTLLEDPRDLVVMNNHLYFVASDSAGIPRYYKMSSSGAISRIFDFCPSASNHIIKSVQTAKGIYVDTANPNSCGERAIVRINNDGTAVGLMADFYPYGTESPLDDAFIANGKSYFTWTTRLYSHDDAGTVVSENGASASMYHAMYRGYPLGNRIYGVTDHTSGRMYWMENGQAYFSAENEGTNWGNALTYSFLFNNRVYFVGNSKLYFMTEDGDVEHLKLRTSGSEIPRNEFVVYENDMYFTANIGANGYQKLLKITPDHKIHQVMDLDPAGVDQISHIWARPDGLYINYDNKRMYRLKKN